MQCGNEIFRYPAQAEPARSNRHVIVKEAVQRGLRVWVDLTHAKRRLTTDDADARRGIVRDAIKTDWVAHASRVLVSASRRNNLFKVRHGGTSSPARET